MVEKWRDRAIKRLVDLKRDGHADGVLDLRARDGIRRL
jgi:hypothetical protein